MRQLFVVVAGQINVKCYFGVRRLNEKLTSTTILNYLNVTQQKSIIKKLKICFVDAKLSRQNEKYNLGVTKTFFRLNLFSFEVTHNEKHFFVTRSLVINSLNFNG